MRVPQVGPHQYELLFARTNRPRTIQTLTSLAPQRSFADNIEAHELLHASLAVLTSHYSVRIGMTNSERTFQSAPAVSFDEIMIDRLARRAALDLKRRVPQ
jgi:hypothetical protein